MSPDNVPIAGDAPVLSPRVLVLLWPSGQAWCRCTSLEREMNPLMSTLPPSPDGLTMCLYKHSCACSRFYFSSSKQERFASCLAGGAGELAVPRPHAPSPNASRQRKSLSSCLPPSVLTSKKTHIDCKLQRSHTAGWPESEQQKSCFFP